MASPWTPAWHRAGSLGSLHVGRLQEAARVGLSGPHGTQIPAAWQQTAAGIMEASSQVLPLPQGSSCRAKSYGRRRMRLATQAVLKVPHYPPTLLAALVPTCVSV